MAILRENDPRVGCLAVPISGLGGFVVLALVAAAGGAGAGVSTVVGVLGAIVGAAASLALVMRAPQDTP